MCQKVKQKLIKSEIQKIIKNKTSLLGKINKSNKSVDRLITEKRERTKILSSRLKERLTMHTLETLKNKKKIFKPLCQIF